MPRFIAFLRAINVGGHTVKMDYLRSIFESIGFSNVETFIASGNVIFESKAKDTKPLEKKIEQTLQKELGYEVATFIRTPIELAGIAKYQAFTPTEIAKSAALNIAFVANPIDATAKQKLLARQTDIDTFHVHDREIYWLCRQKQSDSKFSNAVLEKAIGQPSTLRGFNTIEKMAAKYS